MASCGPDRAPGPQDEPPSGQVSRNAAGPACVVRSGPPELSAGRAFAGVGRAWPDNLAAQGRCPATIGSQAQSGEFPVPVLSVIRKDSPHDISRRAARQVEYQVGVLRHHHLLCAQTAMIQSACGNQLPRNALGWTGERCEQTRGASRRPTVASWRLSDCAAACSTQALRAALSGRAAACPTRALRAALRDVR